MTTSDLLKPRPFGGGNPELWGLKYDVEDDRFVRILSDIGRLIRRSEDKFEKAENVGNPDYLEYLGEVEGDYLEDLIGAAFLALQTKIRRVTKAAEKLRDAMRQEHGIEIGRFSSEREIRGLLGNYRSSTTSLVNLIWDIGNYFKHNDEWPPDVWEEPAPGEKDRLRRERETRRNVQAAGIVQSSTGNMRKTYEFFGIEPYSTCGDLADEVQHWADAVYEHARQAIAASVKPGRARRRHTRNAVRKP